MRHRWHARRSRRHHHRRPFDAGSWTRTHCPSRLSRLARRLPIVLDAQGALLDFQGWRRVPGDLAQPALVGRPVRHPLFQPINAAEHSHRNLGTEAGSQAQGVAHRIVSALRQIECAQLGIGLAIVGHRRDDLLLQDLDRDRVLHAHAHGMTREPLGVAHHQIIGTGTECLAQGEHLGRGTAAARRRVGLVRDEDQLARHGVPVDAVTLLHAGHQTLHHAFDVIHIQTRPMEGAVGERAAQHFAKSTHAAFAQRILRLHHQAARPHTQEHAIAPTIEGQGCLL